MHSPVSSQPNGSRPTPRPARRRRGGTPRRAPPPPKGRRPPPPRPGGPPAGGANRPPPQRHVGPDQVADGAAALGPPLIRPPDAPRELGRDPRGAPAGP